MLDPNDARRPNHRHLGARKALIAAYAATHDLRLRADRPFTQARRSWCVRFTIPLTSVELLAPHLPVKPTVVELFARSLSPGRGIHCSVGNEPFKLNVLESWSASELG